MSFHSIVLGVFSRMVVGWAMANYLRIKLVLAALNIAIGQRPQNDRTSFQLGYLIPFARLRQAVSGDEGADLNWLGQRLFR